ncbi:uncharacterized protein MONOS_10703 [Monocercomonoides exilis]|uniref:uncharacterized protein n=1 Tax=Monocercomonoides exilis TaxID=2049356 RepID=UPI00355A26D1|nr:hypothetical protein MONOS_10703 [Monocercomonoides exilis]|eukprot:MONOS_10703.1-p1 / transcript=MONOS_10703.1 / gene=MONOS_10703 / organism=Monocercomonoides_exilis_PA203 / gene_product=unspecified product / transcript_product=unspecified product / location=Mono_scaffold00496:41597-41935(+) / protein_length=86 / sequence_SO=supercontig / SO=protein_coding / is_pseudo=false
MNFAAKLVAGQALKKAKTGILGDEKDEERPVIREDSPPKPIVKAKDKRSKKTQAIMDKYKSKGGNDRETRASSPKKKSSGCCNIL